MYKVFFKDRTVFFRNDFLEAFRTGSGLFYKLGTGKELKALINAYYEMPELKELYLLHSDVEQLWHEFTQCFRLIEAAGGVVSNSENRILVIFRNDVWDLPKGKVDAGETVEETALREVREECGLDRILLGRKIVDTYHTYRIGNENILKRTHWFEMAYEGNSRPKPQEEENITEIRWVEEDKMDYVTRNTFPSIMEVLKIRNKNLESREK